MLFLEHEFNGLVLVVLLLLELLHGLFLVLDEDLEVETDLAQDDSNLVLVTDLVVAIHKLLEVFGFLPVDVEALEQIEAFGVAWVNVGELIEAKVSVLNSLDE